MRRAVPWLIIVGWVGVAAGFLLRGRYPSGPASVGRANTPTPQATIAPAMTGNVVHTFADEASVQAFAALWQERQGILMRRAMLEEYGKNEQLALQQLNSQLRSQYAIDPDGSYTIDTDQRAILKEETSTVTGAGAATPSGAKPGTAPKGKARATAAPPHDETAERRVHAFADEAAMQAFMSLWRQRQGTFVRMDVLRAYWESEKTRLDQLDKRLVTDYQVDVTKSYTFDQQRRALIEHEPPPAPSPPATPPALPVAGETSAASAASQSGAGEAVSPAVPSQTPVSPQAPPAQPQDQ